MGAIRNAPLQPSPALFTKPEIHSSLLFQSSHEDKKVLSDGPEVFKVGLVAAASRNLQTNVKLGVIFRQGGTAGTVSTAVDQTRIETSSQSDLDIVMLKNVCTGMKLCAASH